MPILAPFIFNPGKEWIFDTQTLRDRVTSKTRAMLLMSPSFPSGGYLKDSDWRCVAQLCLQHDLILILKALQARRDHLLSQFWGLPVGVPSGGWGLFLRVSDFGKTSEDAYADLLSSGVLVNVSEWICDTHANQYVCLIFSNVTLQDLEDIGKKIRRHTYVCIYWFV